MYIDDCRLKGVVNLVLRDENGKVKQHKTIRNKVTRDGIAHIIGRMIDDGQDRAGLHKMPRMMSHMAIGIGAAAREARDTYTATDFDNLPQNSAALGISDLSGTTTDLVTARKQAAVPKSYDKRLQDERGFRVQLMKDTTLASDYAPLQDLLLSQSGSVVMHSLTSDNKSELKFQAGSGGTPTTISKLRVGLKLTGLTAGSGIPAPGGAQGADNISSENLKIAKIESAAGITTITLDGALATQPGSSTDTIYLDVEYVNRIPLTSYTIGEPHPTHTAVRSVMEPPAGVTHPTGPFAAAAARGVSGADYYENGKGMLGITRGQIGAFYERELEYNIQLTHTDAAGLPINLTTNPNGDLSVLTTIDEAGFAVLDSGVARFPFIGAEEDKPAGIATSGAATTAGTNTATTRGTEFVQFGTAVDGIFQGALIGSSIIANASDGTVEGYGPEENNYANSVGGLTSNAAANEQPLASFVASNALTYSSSASYTPNAAAGSKKTGDRIVYVATFKENNPRPEVDYDVFDVAGTHRAPLKRVYPITEAGIFNKHVPDLGIFDVGDRSYNISGGTDSISAELAHIDKRGSQAASTSTLTYSVGSGTPTGPVDGLLTTDGKSITGASLGFTKGPVTQTMLCRTTFDPVNKATADTLQITWSVQLQDTTT
jgi:hypothetical protein